jgi:hypothetical protein
MSDRIDDDVQAAILFYRVLRMRALPLSAATHRFFVSFSR